MAIKLQSLEESKAFCKQKNLKLKNQIAHLDCLLRKKQSLMIEIERMRKLINLNRRSTQETLKESFQDVRTIGDDIIISDPEVDSELSDLFAEFSSLEENYNFLLEEFSE